jgi:hypothetical protein
VRASATVLPAEIVEVSSRQTAGVETDASRVIVTSFSLASAIGTVTRR